MAQLNNTTTGTRYYYNIIEGDLRRKALATDAPEFIVKRTTKQGKEVDEFVAKSGLSGVIKSFELVTEEYQGKRMTSLVINLYDIGETYLIQVPKESKYFSTFIQKLPNINLSQPVQINSFKFTPSDKPKPISGFSIKQNGVKVENFFSKENPLPGVPNFPTGGDENEIKMWSIQQVIALDKVLKEQQERLKEAPSVSNAPLSKEEANEFGEEIQSLPF